MFLCLFVFVRVLIFVGFFFVCLFVCFLFFFFFGGGDLSKERRITSVPVLLANTNINTA